MPPERDREARRHGAGYATVTQSLDEHAALRVMASKTPPANDASPQDLNALLPDGGSSQNALVRVQQVARRLAGRIPRKAAYGSLIVVAVLVMIVSLAFARIWIAPLSLDNFRSSIEASLGESLGGFPVSIGEASLIYTYESGPRVRLRDVAINSSQDGTTLAQVPEADIELSIGAMTDFQLAPEQIELVRPLVHLAYEPRTGLTLKVGSPDTVEESATEGGTQSDTRGVASTTSRGANTAALTDAARLPAAWRSGRIELAATLSTMLRDFRSRKDGTRKFTKLALRDAVVVFASGGRTTQWSVPSLTVGLRHNWAQSLVVGEARLIALEDMQAGDSLRRDAGSEGREAETTVAFTIAEANTDDNLHLKTEIKRLVPSALPRALPFGRFLAEIPNQVSGDVSLRFNRSGALLDAAGHLVMAKSDVGMTQVAGLPIDELSVDFAYESSKRQITVFPSRLILGEYDLSVRGRIEPRLTADGSGDSWGFKLETLGGFLGNEGTDPLPIEHGMVTGSVFPQRGSLLIERLNLAVPGGQLALAGELLTTGAVGLDLVLGPMSADTARRLWPAGLGDDARLWVGENLRKGKLDGGRIRASLTADEARQVFRGGELPPSVLQARFDVSDVAFVTAPGMPLIEGPKVQILTRGHVVTMEMPDGRMATRDGRVIKLSDGRLRVANFTPKIPDAVVDLRFEAPARAVAEALELFEIERANEVPPQLAMLESMAEGQISLSFPLHHGLQPHEISTRSTAVIKDVRLKNAVGDINIQGGDLKVAVTDHTAEVSGKLLFNGVPADVRMLRLLAAGGDSQPPLTISAELDEQDRDQLGIKINHIIRGRLPVLLAVDMQDAANPLVSVRADMTNVGVVLDQLAWTKLPGRQALLTFDIRAGDRGNTEFQNFKIFGDDIAIDGWMALAPDYSLSAFNFPDFSIDLVTRLELSGVFRDDKVWDVRVNGPSYDGREFFRSLLGANAQARGPAPPPDRAGMDITAEIGTMIGFSKLPLRDVTMRASDRGGKLTSLVAQGKLGTGRPFTAELQRSNSGHRLLVARSPDAGEAFRLIGLFDAIEGGNGELRVNLDGAGNADIVGELWTSNFALLGNPIVDEVISESQRIREGTIRTTPPPRPRSAGAEQRRTRLPFDHMRIPFSSGQGQFILRRAQIKGPIVGATLKGKVDFVQRSVRLDGTYVPVPGINSVLDGIPIIGDLLVGRSGEGIVGITFLIVGPIDNPRVDVNPASAVAPGFLRQIFEYSPRDPEITDREESAVENLAPAQSSSLAPVTAGSGGGTSATQGRSETGTASGGAPRDATANGANAAQAAPPTRRRKRPASPNWETIMRR